MQISRQHLTTCIHAETYQYFVQTQDAIKCLWSRLQQHYGQIQHNSFHVMWIETPYLLIKAPQAGTPITVIRKHSCQAIDIDTFHCLIDYACDEEARNCP